MLTPRCHDHSNLSSDLPRNPDSIKQFFLPKLASWGLSCKRVVLLSTVPSFTSNPFPILSDTSDFPYCPILLFPPFVFPLLQIHLSLMLPLIHPNSVLPLSSWNIHSSLNSESVLSGSPLLFKPPVLKPVVSFNTNQSDYCVLIVFYLYPFVLPYLSILTHL